MVRAMTSLGVVGVAGGVLIAAARLPRWAALRPNHGTPFTGEADRQPPSGRNLPSAGGVSDEAIALPPGFNWWQLAQPALAKTALPFSTSSGRMSMKSSSFGAL